MKKKLMCLFLSLVMAIGLNAAAYACIVDAPPIGDDGNGRSFINFDIE